jgi:SAM-dependent methyltransferase
MILSALFNKHNWTIPTSWGYKVFTTLDFGCGDNPRNPFAGQSLFGLDIVGKESPNLNLTKTGLNRSVDFQKVIIKRGQHLPFNDDFFDAVTLFDVVEHLSREPQDNSNEFIETMNELSRVLKIGGVLLAVTPAYPSPAAFQDPTHINIISESTYTYFVGDKAPAALLGYGFRGSFEMIDQFWVGPQNRLMKNDNLIKKNLIQNCSKLMRTPRATLSGFRKPTHLVWLMKKVKNHPV